MGNLSGQLIKGTGSYEVKEIVLEQGNLVADGSWTKESQITESPTGTFTWIGDSADSSIWMLKNAILTIGKSYRISFDTLESNVNIVASIVINYITPDALPYAFDDNGVHLKEVGHHVYTVNYVNAGTGTGRVQIQLENSVDNDHVVINNIQVEEIPALPTLDKGTKYLECTLAGSFAFESNQVYGEWEFDILKTYETGALSVGIIGTDSVISSNNNGYYFNFSSTESIRFRVLTAGSASTVTQSVDAYIELDVWYRIKVTRTLDGEFYLYIKGGDFGLNDWTLIIAGLSGANPVTNTTFTESLYIYAQMNNGDRITNFETRKAVQQ